MILLELSSHSQSTLVAPLVAPLVEGLTTDDSNSDGDIGVTVGKYTTKIDQLGKTVDSMQATILGLLPTVTKNTQDNEKNQQAIQSIIANKNKN